MSTADSSKQMLQPVTGGSNPLLSQKDMTFIVSPPEIGFHSFEAHKRYEAALTFKNQTKTAKYIRLLPPENRFFSISEPRAGSNSLKVAAGLSVTYSIFFQPEEDSDYECDLVAVTANEKFVVPVRALGSRGHLMFPPLVHFPSAPIKATSKSTVLIINVGHKACQWKASSTAPFAISPTFGHIPSQGDMQVVVEFTPMSLLHYESSIMFDLGNGDVQSMRVSGECADVEIHMDVDTLFIAKTFISLERQDVVRVSNNSDATVSYCWKEHGTEQEENTARSRMLKMEALNQQRGGGSNQLVPSGGGSLKRRASAQNQPLLFDDPVFTIEPIQGQIAAKGYREFVVTFNPQHAQEYSAFAYLDIQGKRDRMPLTIRGAGLGPQCNLSFDSLDLGDIFIHQTHPYFVELENRGSIEAKYAVLPNATLFGPRFSFSPSSGTLGAGSTQRVDIKFFSEKIGIVSETFKIHIQGSKDLEMHFKGRVIGPTFHFSVEELDFGNVSYNFWHVKHFELVNTSKILMKYSLHVPEDNQLKKEFDVIPNQGTILPLGKQKIQVDFLSNTPGEYNAYLVVDIEEVGNNLDSLPIKATCIVPEIHISTEALDYEHCFIGYRYSKEVELRNDTALSGKYEFVLPSEDDPSRARAEIMVGSGDAKERKGIVHARSTQRLHIFFTAKKTGNIHVQLYVRILGSERAPHPIQITAKVTGPKIDITEKHLDFGPTEVLHETLKTIPIPNNSPIPAKWKAHLTGKHPPHVHPPFSLPITEGTIKPGSTAHLQVNAFLDEAMRFTDEVMIQIQDNQEPEIISLTAVGKGFTLQPSIPLDPVQFGDVFTTVPVKKVFTIFNKGRKPQSIQWNNERGKGKEGDAPIIFHITPERATINGKSEESFTIDGLSKVKGNFQEKFVCKVSQTHKLVFKAGVQGNFQDPLLQYSSNSLSFNYVYNPDGDQAFMSSRPLTMKNISNLDLDFTLRVGKAGEVHPFTIDQSEFSLKHGESAVVNVSYDASYRGDRVSHKVSTKLIVSFESSGHNQKDSISLVGELQFPNLAIDATAVDFGCILNDTEQRKVISITNTSKVTAVYTWIFDEEPEANPSARKKGHAGEGAVSIPVNNVFDLIPFRGSIAPGATENVEVLFCGIPGKKFSATAVCQLEGGPDYPLTLSGEASFIHYRFDKVALDFGSQEYDKWEEKEITISNMGKVPFPFQVDLSLLSRPGMVEVIPVNGVIKDKAKLVVRFSPRVPDRIDDFFRIQVAHFEPQIINVKGLGSYSSIAVTHVGNVSYVKRNDPPTFKPYLAEAKLKISQPDYKPYSAIPTKAGEPVVDPVLAEAERMYFRDIITEDAIMMKSVASGDVQEQSAERISQIKRKTYIGETKYILSRYIMDLGNVRKGDTAKRPFKITNTSTMQIMFGVDRRALANSAISLSPEKFPKLAAHGQISVDVTFNSKAKGVGVGSFSTEVLLDIKNGPLILLEVRAFVIIPSLDISNDKLDFGQVQVGLQHSIFVAVENTQALPCEWQAQYPDAISETRAKKKKEVHGKFVCIPDHGILPPQQQSMIEIAFIPTVNETLTQKVHLRLTANPKVIELNCTGVGEELQLGVDPGEIELPSVFPYQQSRKQFQLTNKSSVPIEVFSYNFDQRYLVEEEILRNAEEYFEKDVLLLEPRDVGASLPDQLMEAYYKKLLGCDERFAQIDLIPTDDSNVKPVEAEKPATVQPSVPLPPLDAPPPKEDQPKPVVLVVTGPPLSGKTTHTRLLAEKFGLKIISIDQTIRTAMEMDTPEGATLRSICHRHQEPHPEPSVTPQLTGKEAKNQPPPPPVEITASFLTSIMKQRFKQPDVAHGVVIDDVDCFLTPNADVSLTAIRDAAVGLSIPFTNINLAMDEMLIRLREAMMECNDAEKNLKDATIKPLPENEYDKLDEMGRRSHDLALKHFRRCQKAMQQATDKVNQLNVNRNKMKAESKLFTLQEEVEKELQEAKEQEDPKNKKGAAKGKQQQVEVPVVKWEDLDKTTRNRRIYTTSKTLFDENSFLVSSVDMEIEEAHAKICEDLPVAKLFAEAKAEAQSDAALATDREKEKHEVSIPAPETKQRIERPPERRSLKPITSFKILTPNKKFEEAGQAALLASATKQDPKAKAAEKKADAKGGAQSATQDKIEPFTEETRWIIPPFGVMDLTLQFCTEDIGPVSNCLLFGIVGSNLEFPLVCRTACACPELVRDPKTIFHRKARSRPEEKFFAKTYITSKKAFEFGPLLVLATQKSQETAVGKGAGKGKAQAQEAQSAVQIAAMPNGMNADKLHFTNNGLFAAEVSLVMENEKDKTFAVQPDNFVLGVGESTNVTLIACPNEVGEVKNSIIACIKDNPEPIRIDISCNGSKPEVTVNGKKDCSVDFGRLLLRRKEERKVPIKNVCALPVKWRVVGAEKLPPELKLDCTSGVLDVGAEFNVTLSFFSERANTFNIPLKLEISDFDNTGIYESLPFVLKAESHDVVLEWTKEVDFKTVRVGEAKKETFKLMNKGPYEVAYMFRMPKKLTELLTITPMEGTLKGMPPQGQGGKGGQEAQIVQVEVTFKSDREISIGKKSADLEVAFIEPTLKELVYPPQFIQVRAEALYNKYQVKPMHINFGPCLYKQKKQATFDISNTGCFDIKYRLFSLRDGLQKSLEAPPEPAHGKKAPEKKPKKGEAAVDLSEMQLGAFSVTPSTGMIVVGQTTTVTVSIQPEGSNLFSELLGVHIEDRDPNDNPEGIAFDLEAESCVPGIVADLDNPDSDTIFEEQQITSRLDGYKKMSSVFAREEKVFSFGVALSGRRLTERFRLTNPVKVPCTIQLAILPRGDAPDAKQSAEAFDIQGLKADGGKLTIPPHEHRYVTVGFTPSSLNTFSAMFEANVEGGLEPKTKTLRFELRGEGSLPNLALDVPPPPAKTLDLSQPVDVKPVKSGKQPAPKGAAPGKGAPVEEEKVPPNTLVLPRTILNSKTSRAVTVRNVGELPATIRFQFPMSSQNCFSFPSRNEDMKLLPGAVEKYSLFFEPSAIGEFHAKLTMIVQDNHYEDSTINVVGEGYMDTLTFEDVDENTENRLTLGDCYVGQTKTKPFFIHNHSANVLRFNWTTQNASLRCEPTCGHLAAGTTKQVQCILSANAPLSELSKCNLSFQQIQINNPQAARGPEWDDTQTTAKWIPEMLPKSGDDGDDSSRVIRGPLKKVVERVEEPSYTPIDTVPQSKELFVSCMCDYTSYEISYPVDTDRQGANQIHTMMFNRTKLFQSRTIPLVIKNTGKVNLPCNFSIFSEDRDELPDAEVGNFVVEPLDALIAPNQTQEFQVIYKPVGVGDHRHLLIANLLYGPKPEHLTYLFGSSECPLIHFELPPSDYFNHRDSDLPHVDPNSCIVEFHSRGVKIRNTVRFLVLNPTNMGFEFEWDEVRAPGAPATSFKCNSQRGSIHSGKKYEMVFEYTPDNLKLSESVWNFTIVGKTTIPFLLVGHASEPDVYFSSTRVQFGQVIVGAKTKQTVYIENRETVAYPFQFDRLPPGASVTATPMSGTVAPNSSIPVDIIFSPAAEENYNYTLVCKVRKAVTPITCNVKGEGYTTHDSLRVQESDGVITSVVPQVTNNISLGKVQVNGKITRKLILSNQGRYNLDYRWTIPPHPFVSISQLLGTVLPNGDSAVELTYAPTKESRLTEFKLQCKITNGSTYNMYLTGVAAVPSVHFSWKDFDFGACFVYGSGPKTKPKVLLVTNNDIESVSIDCLFDNKDYLELDASSFVLDPQQTKAINVSFMPRESIIYNETLSFSINDLTTVSCHVRGEGTIPKVEVLNKQVRFGTCRIGDRRDVEVRVVSKSKIDTTISLKNMLPPELEKLGVSVNPHEDVTFHPKDVKVFIFSFRPPGRLRQFSGEMNMLVAEQQIPFASISGSCQGAEVHLDNKQISFGQVVVGTRVSKKVTIMNTGDLGLEFKWNEDKLGKDYNISPAVGYIGAHTEQICEVSYAPTKEGTDGKRDSIDIKFSEGLSLGMSIANSNCVEKPAITDTLVFSCRVRETSTAKVSIRNDSVDTWTLRPNIDNAVWSAAETLVVRPKEAADLAVTYAPQTCTKNRVNGANDEGYLFFPLPNGTAMLYKLDGSSDPPGVAAPPIERDVIAKTAHVEKLVVNNWLKHPQKFDVIMDFSHDKSDESVVIKGVPSLDVPANATREYKINFFSYREMKITGTVHFTNNQTQEYQFYNLVFNVKSAKEVAVVELKTQARVRKATEISITNPLGKQVTLNTKVDCPDIIIPPQVSLPAKGTAKIPVEFFPLVVKDYPPAKLVMNCPELGDFPYTLQVAVQPPLPEKPIRMQCALGQLSSTTLRFTHFCKTATDFQCKFSDPKQTSFYKSNTQATLKVNPCTDLRGGQEVGVDVTFEPSRVGDCKETIEISSTVGGMYSFPLHGTCTPPQRQGPIEIRPNQTAQIQFKNVFSENVNFSFATDAPNFVVGKPAELILSKKNAAISVQYKADDPNQVVRGKLTISGQPVDGAPSQWVYYLRGMKESEIENLPSPVPTKKK